MAARAGSKLVRDPKGALVRHDDGRPLVLPNSPHARGGRLARLQLELERGGVIDGRRA